MKNHQSGTRKFALSLLPAVAFLGVATYGLGDQKKDLVETAVSADGFHTLVAAVEAAGLTHTLKGHGPLTVFAPTDEAFAKLPRHTLDSLLKPENKHELERILKYHVVSGKVMAKDALRAGSAETLAGDKIQVSLDGGQLAINDADVVENDLEASNGIIHVIDTVLLPPERVPVSLEPGTEVSLLPRINPASESSLESKTSREPVSLTFANLSSRPVLVHWIDYHGEREQWRGKIEPGELATCERTYASHVWLVTDLHGKGLGLYTVGGKDALIVNTH